MSKGFFPLPFSSLLPSSCSFVFLWLIFFPRFLLSHSIRQKKTFSIFIYLPPFSLSLGVHLLCMFRRESAGETYKSILAAERREEQRQFLLSSFFFFFLAGQDTVPGFPLLPCGPSNDPKLRIMRSGTKTVQPLLHPNPCLLFVACLQKNAAAHFGACNALQLCMSGYTGMHFSKA